MPFLMLKQEVHEGLFETYHILLLSLGLQALIDIADQIEQIVPIVIAPFLIDLVDIEAASSILIIQFISFLDPLTFHLFPSFRQSGLASESGTRKGRLSGKDRRRLLGFVARIRVVSHGEVWNRYTPDICPCRDPSPRWRRQDTG